MREIWLARPLIKLIVGLRAGTYVSGRIVFVRRKIDHFPYLFRTVKHWKMNMPVRRRTGYKLDRLVGRYVRLKESTFLKVSEGTSKVFELDNLFLVSAITRGMNKIICYRANVRIAVSLSEVILV